MVFVAFVLKQKFSVPRGTGFIERPTEPFLPQTYILCHLSTLLSQCKAKQTFPSLSTWLWSCEPFRSHNLIEIDKSGSDFFSTMFQGPFLQVSFFDHLSILPSAQ